MDQCGDIQITDSYRWLEDSGDPEVQGWIDAQNKHTNYFLKNKKFDLFSEELVKNFRVTNFSNPFPVNGLYFYTERQPNDDQRILLMKAGLNGEPVKLVDPNEIDKNGTATIDHWAVSYTGKYLAYGISIAGDEMATLHIKDVQKNIDLTETITHCMHSSIKWLLDDSGFFYTRNPRPGTVPKNEMHMHTKVYFHRLGNHPDNDKLIFGENRPKDDMISLRLSPDGRYLSISVFQKWTENEIYIYDQETKTTTSLIKKVPARFEILFLKDKVLLKTNYKANNFRVLFSLFGNMHKPVDEWEEFISEQENLLASIFVTKDKILFEYLVNACSKITIINHNGNKTGDINLPKYSNLGGISSRIEESEFFYCVESFILPKIIYRYNPKNKDFELYRTTNNPIKPEDYVVNQEWYVSKDGTRVPMFIIHKNGLKKDGTNPTILYGYGGFGDIEGPSFMRSWVPWLKRGGVFAIANIRGGGEYGKDWHLGGIKEKKQNSFDDFISAAQYLISEKYTDTKHLGIMGGSNGGLLVCAVAMQRPELFKAVRSSVPLTDMARFSMFGMAVRWIHEYGDPTNPVDIKNILKWSPYHNVKKDHNYPSFLFTTAENDSRVNPLHARKMSAMLQEMSKNKNIFLFTDIDAGHGSGKPIWKIVEGQALTLAFFAKELGLGN